MSDPNTVPTIGILQTGHAPADIKADMGDYDAMFADLLAGHGLNYVTYNVVDNEFPNSAQECDGWLITGSKHGAYEDHDWIPPLEQLIRDIQANGSPLIGVCFGHQIIAQALGGVVEKFKNGWSIGRTEYVLDGQPIALNAWHQDQVTTLPPGATVIGNSDFCDHAFLMYGDTILTMQPHPEHTSAFVQRLIESRGRGLVPDPLLDGALTQLDNPTDSQTMADRMAAFLKRGA
ncbi:type 1 glutamine amidotransferase [Roseovarius aestuarii]|nr:type 1 glutamine amidotransferase [Roseovarius aestuarii]